MSVAVVIPVKNGGELLKRVIQKVTEQDLKPSQIICIDSGSTDGSVEFLKSMKGEGVQCIEIPPSEFGHGRTRNLAISKCNTEFVALLTQDALPADSFWLGKLIQPMIQNAKIGGVFGPHLPYPETRSVERAKVEGAFKPFFNHAALWSKGEKDLGYLYFFSNNNSAIRRSVWEKIPFPDTEMGEDQLWCKAMIEAGHLKAFTRDALVFHSHHYDLNQTLRRQYDEMSVHIGLHGITQFASKPLWRWFASEIKKDLSYSRSPFTLLTQIPYSFYAALGKWLRVKHERQGLRNDQLAKFSMQNQIKKG